jgi:hypothetical protein
VEFGVLRRKNKAVFVLFFGTPENMTLSSMVPHEASSEHSEGSSHLLDSTFGSRYGQSSLPKYVVASASVSLSVCLYGSMIFLLLFIAIISSFVRSLSDFNRVGIHWQLGHPKRQGIRSWQRINCMCRKTFSSMFSFRKLFKLQRNF